MPTIRKTAKGVTPATYTYNDKKIGPLGCLGCGVLMLVLFIGMIVLMGALFTWAFNIVAPIFGWPPIDIQTGIVMWFLIVLIGSAFRRAT